MHIQCVCQRWVYVKLRQFKLGPYLGASWEALAMCSYGVFSSSHAHPTSLGPSFIPAILRQLPSCRWVGKHHISFSALGLLWLQSEGCLGEPHQYSHAYSLEVWENELSRSGRWEAGEVYIHLFPSLGGWFWETFYIGSQNVPVALKCICPQRWQH